MKVLGESAQRLVASPALFARVAQAEVPADLPRLPTLNWGTALERVSRLRQSMGNV